MALETVGTHTRLPQAGTPPDYHRWRSDNSRDRRSAGVRGEASRGAASGCACITRYPRHPSLVPGTRYPYRVAGDEGTGREAISWAMEKDEQHRMEARLQAASMTAGACPQTIPPTPVARILDTLEDIARINIALAWELSRLRQAWVALRVPSAPAAYRPPPSAYHPANDLAALDDRATDRDFRRFGLRQAQFRQAAMGYHTDEVDDLLERVASALDAGVSPSLLIKHAQFHWAVHGYAYEEVDQFLTHIVRSSTAIDVPARQLRPTSPPRELVGLWMTAPESGGNELWLVAP
jgi:DivIVA domain-containing protein